MNLGYKRGELLIEDIIFIVLNLVFISILVVFLFTRTGSAAVLEEKYAKEIALMIDSLPPISEFEIDLDDALSKSEKGYKDNLVVVNENENTVTVKLREDGGYPYSFFNDVNVVLFRSSSTKYTFKILEKGGANN